MPQTAEPSATRGWNTRSASRPQLRLEHPEGRDHGVALRHRGVGRGGQVLHQVQQGQVAGPGAGDLNAEQEGVFTGGP